MKTLGKVHVQNGWKTTQTPASPRYFKFLCICKYMVLKNICLKGLCRYEGLSEYIYCIPRHIRRAFPPEKCDLNSACVLCAEGKYYLQIYKYPYIYYTTSLLWHDLSGSDNDFLGLWWINILWLIILVCNNPVFFQKMIKIKIHLSLFFLKFPMKNQGASYRPGNTVRYVVPKHNFPY
jgi:hypothetical protein